jgi:hypothetical protein
MICYAEPMLLLLSGGSETARMLLAEKFLADHADWKHLALEDLREDEEWNDDIDMQDMFGTMVACDCAIEEHDKGSSVLITCPSLALVDTVQDALPKTMITVHMGAEAIDKEFDHQIDTTEHSANETFFFLNSLVT